MRSVGDILRLLPSAQQSFARDWGAYSLVWNPLNGGIQNSKATVITQDDSDFLIISVTRYVTDTAATPVETLVPQVTIDLRAGDRTFFPDQNPVHINALAASAKEGGGPRELEFPVYIPRQTSLVGFASNITAGTNYVVRLTFWGIRIFNYGRSQARI